MVEKARLSSASDAKIRCLGVRKLKHGLGDRKVKLKCALRFYYLASARGPGAKGWARFIANSYKANFGVLLL